MLRKNCWNNYRNEQLYFANEQENCYNENDFYNYDNDCLQNGNYNNVENFDCYNSNDWFNANWQDNNYNKNYHRCNTNKRKNCNCNYDTQNNCNYFIEDNINQKKCRRRFCICNIFNCFR